jgi:hypothetical protein
MEESSEVNAMSEQKIEEFYRDATADDVARVMRGETVEARFRSEDSEEWRDEPFTGWTKTDHTDDFVWSGLLGISYRFCQVYDPPAWFLNKPEPGEGYRLLGKFPPEDLLPTDEAKWPCDGKWHVHKEGSGKQIEEMWYRRRIANNPTSSDSSRSRDTIPSGWRVLGKDEERLASDAYWSQSCKEWIVLGDDRVGVANREGLHAIRQIVVADFFLLEGYDYSMPGGQTIRITAKGFEVL